MEMNNITLDDIIIQNNLHSEDGIKYIFAKKSHLDEILDILADAFAEEPLS